MSKFIDKLEEWAAKDTKVRAVLRRSLAFDPGDFPHAYPYVELFLKQDEITWNRKMYYLVAGLWAAHWREGRSETKISLAKACADYRVEKKSASIEMRFISLLDADLDQLPYRLRHIIALLKEYPIDFETLFNDLLRWNSERKKTQNAWTRDFYRVCNAEQQEIELLVENN